MRNVVPPSVPFNAETLSHSSVVDLQVQVTYGVGVELVAAKASDTADTQDDDERLLRDYSPVLCLYPEGVPGTPPPYFGTNDYHPRAVEGFLQRVRRAGVGLPNGWSALWWLAAVGSWVIGIPAIFLYAITDTPMLWYVKDWQPYALMAAWFGVGLIAIVTWGRHLSSAEEVRRAMADPRARGLSSRYMTMAAEASGLARTTIWADYCQEVHAGSKYPRTVYGRVVRAGDQLCLQYWQFYLYNDWWNIHQADWEVSMVFMRVGPTGTPKPKAAAYSSHYGGRLRAWPLVEKVDGHPRIYVAKGSHAQYFALEEGGYRTELRLPMGLRFLSGTLLLYGEKDRVASPSGAKPETYELIVVPDGAATVAHDDPRWEKWWWLKFAGKWGWDERWWLPMRDLWHREEPVEGPAIQEGAIRWNTPWAWGESCTPDAGSWESTGA
jgi:hypothetical protein